MYPSFTSFLARKWGGREGWGRRRLARIVLLQQKVKVNNISTKNLSELYLTYADAN
jgi:hypothetical protein